MKKQFRVIAIHHTHWDREWYFTEEAAKVILEENWHRTLEGLKRKNFPSFLVDDQESLLESLNYNPNLANFLQNGKIYTTPIHTQQDFFSTTYQTILRNIATGLHFYEKFRLPKPQTIYLPDSFGFSPALSLALKKHGFKNMLTWRGLPAPDVEKTVYLNWNGINLYCMRETGYGGFWHFQMKEYCEIRHDKKLLKKWFEKYYEEVFKSKIANYKARTPAECNGVIILPWGSDLAPVLYDSKLLINWLNEFDPEASYEFGNYETAFSLMGNAKHVVSDIQLRHSSRSKIHRTIDSSRYSVKKLFREAELLLYNYLEPLKVIYYQHFGHYFEFKTGERAFERLLVSSSHDGLGGCSSDATMADIENRIKRSIDNFETQIDLIKKHFAFNLKLKVDDLLLWNLTPYPGEFNKLLEIYSRNPNVSYNAPEVTDSLLHHEQEGIKKNYYRSVHIIKTKFNAPFSFKILRANHSTKNIEVTKPPAKNCFASINNNRFTVQTAGKINYKFKLAFSIDCGDTYDFSTDTSMQETSVIKSFSFSNLKNSYYTTELPFNLITKDEMKITGKIVLSKENENNLVDLKIVLNNQAQNFKASLVLERTENTPYVEAMHQDLLIARHNKSIPDNWKTIYFDYPFNSFATDGFIKNGKQQKIATFGTNEFQFNNQEIWITLMRSVPFLGRENLPYRPGVASGSPEKYVPTPGACETGIRTFDFQLANQFVRDERFYNASRFSTTSYYMHKSSNPVFWRADYFSIIPRMNELIATVKPLRVPHHDEILDKITVQASKVKLHFKKLLQLKDTATKI